MKNLYVIAVLLFTIAACGTKEKTQEEIRAGYITDAQDFFNEQVIKMKGAGAKIKSISVDNIDTIRPVSSCQYEVLQMQPLSKLCQIQKELVENLIELNGANGESTEYTQQQMDELKLLADSLKRWTLRANGMNKKDKVLYQVMLTCSSQKTDGSSIKDIKIPFYFDLEHKLKKDIMESFMAL